MARNFEMSGSVCDPARTWTQDHFFGHCGMVTTKHRGWARDEWINLFDGKSTLGFRTFLSQTKIWSFVTEDTFFVVPAAWPEGVEEAFRLKEAPTPYEVACRFMIDCVGPNAASTCDLSLLWWWLAGLPEYVLEDLGYTPKMQLRRVISALCERIAFKVWALGTDLVPATEGNPNCMQFVQALRTGEVLPHNGMARNSDDAVYGSDWVRGQLLSGERLLPIERFLQNPGYFFKTVEAKQARFPKKLE